MRKFSDLKHVNREKKKLIVLSTKMRSHLWVRISTISDKNGGFATQL